MAINPNDPMRDRVIDPEMSASSDQFAEDRVRENARLRNDQMMESNLIEPELDDGSSSGGRIALYGIAVLAILGAVFYGLNSSNTTNTASNSPPSTTAQTTPAPNMAPGTTTGAAPAPRPESPMNNSVTPGGSPNGSAGGKGGTY